MEKTVKLEPKKELDNLQERKLIINRDEYKNELLLTRLLARTEIDSDKVLEIVKKVDNWGAFLNEVYKNKIALLVNYHLFQQQLFPYIPRYVVASLMGYRHYNQLKLDTYFKIIRRITEIFEQEKIDYIFMKGFDIIDKLYAQKSPYIREFNDLDILVLEDDLTKVEKLFLKQGYVFGVYNNQDDTILPASRYDIIRMRMDSHQIETFVKKVAYDEKGLVPGPIYIDVNFTIFDGGKNSVPISTRELLLNRVKRISFNNIEYYSLSCYDTFLQLVYHLYRETKFEMLKDEELDVTLHKFCDIHEYLLKMDGSWDINVLRNMIQRNELQEVFWFVLYFMDLLYETKYLVCILGNEINFMDKYYLYIKYFKDRFGLEE